MKKQILAFGLALITITGGCTLLGPNPKPPTQFEQALFTTITNYVEVQKIVTLTNLVPKEVIVYTTNEVGRIVTVTNTETVPVYVTTTNTVTIPTYTLKPNELATGTAATATSVINAYAPGVGTAVGGVLLGLLSMWAKLRSTKNTGTALAQEIEAIREFVKTLPEGAKYDAVIVQFLKDHQREQGAITQIIDLLAKSVSNPDAKAAVEEMKNALAMLK